MKTKYTMTNFATKQTVKKIQNTEPRMKGFTCVDRELVLPGKKGCQRLLRDAFNRPYYAAEDPEGFHFHP